MRLSLDAVPEGIDPEEVRQCLKDLPGVAEVHDLHIWAMSTTKTALTAHLVTADRTARATDPIQGANRALHDRFQIEHTTLNWKTPTTTDRARRNLRIPCRGAGLTNES